MKKRGGAPTKYKEEYCEKIIEFYSRDCFEKVEGQHRARKLPTLVEFAKHIKVGISTIYDWINPDHPSYKKRFSDIYKTKVTALQKNALIQGGLLGYYNPVFCKFVATNLTDMKETQEVGLGGGAQIIVIRSGGQVEQEHIEHIDNQTKALPG